MKVGKLTDNLYWVPHGVPIQMVGNASNPVVQKVHTDWTLTMSECMRMLTDLIFT